MNIYIVLQLLVPNASFVGHIAGILAGLTYVWNVSAFRIAWKPISFILSYPTTVGIASFLVSSHLDLFRKPWKTKHFW